MVESIAVTVAGAVVQIHIGMIETTVGAIFATVLRTPTSVAAKYVGMIVAHDGNQSVVGSANIVVVEIAPIVAPVVATVVASVVPTVVEAGVVVGKCFVGIVQPS
jgi:hypothetical protein